MPSFDVVSKLEMHEVENAVQQAKKEVGQRYDFRGTNTIIDKSEEGISIRSDGQGRVDAALDVLRGKLAKRKVSLLAIDPQPVQPASGKGYKQLIKLKQGVEKDEAKKIVKAIKDSKMKLQASIQGDLVRVTGKKRDDLQAAISLLKGADLGLPLQFENFRD